MGRKVYVPNLPMRWDAATRKRVPSFDINAAAKFGEIVVMSEGSSNGETINRTIQAVQRKAEEITDNDLVLLMGDVVVTAACLALVCDNNAKVNVLRWDKKKRVYDIMEVAL